MQPVPLSSKIATLQQTINELALEKGRLEAQLRLLEAAPISLFGTGTPDHPKTVLRPQEKFALFLELFARAARRVYPKFWENPAAGKKGYSPAYVTEHSATGFQKRFLPLDERVVETHLRGPQAIGVYALRPDDACIFLAADFDGDGWKEDALAYKDAAAKLGVTASIERSRSGNGGHAWIFFSEPVPAASARSLGIVLVAKASALRPTMSLSAYDRLFPNQDTMPSGGFGNLIALPLAGGPRKLGNMVFLNDQLDPIPDQWAFLSGVSRLRREDLDRILGQIAPLPALGSSGDDPISFALEKDESALDLSRPSIKAGMISGEVTLRLDSRLHLSRTIPPGVSARAFKRLATFPNPVFHEKLRLRFSTYDTPRFIFAGEWHPDRLVLPRGAVDSAIAILESAGAGVSVQDARPDGSRIPWAFHGELRPEQEAAVRKMTVTDYGILCAPPGAGKTVMGCALIARHRTATLVLVHRTVLLDQWRQEAAKFLGITKRKEIGIWRGATRRLTHKLDIAMLPSLARLEDYAAFFQGYGLVIVDECHHVPAVTFEALLKACPVRKIVGLTATPKRKDGLEKLLHLQCGPIRHTLRQPSEEAIPRTVYVRRSSFHVPDELGQRAPIHAVWEALVSDDGRAEQIVGDIWACLAWMASVPPRSFGPQSSS